MSVTLGAICNGIETTLSAALGLEESEAYDELRDSLPSDMCPLLQVYPGSGSCDVGGRTDRTTFGGDVRQKQIVILADLYASERSFLKQDMESTVDMLDALIDVLETQDDKPFFGVVGIQAFKWSWKRVTLRFGDAHFMGARFTITLRIF